VFLLYDCQGRLPQLSNTISSTDLGTFSYGYDSPLLGQRTSMISALGATSYSYDSNYQLTGATYPSGTPFNGEVHVWTYDNIGNRLTNTVNSTNANYTYFKNGANPLNGQRLQSDSVKTYAYDSNGNVTGDGTYTYTWDYENRLTGITGGGLTASYSYDYLGRRKSKTIAGVMTSYLYDGPNIVREVNSIVTDYISSPKIDEPLGFYRSGSASYFNIAGLRSIVSVSDPTGVLQNSYDYDAWGILRNQTITVQNSFTYTGRESAEIGLYFYRARLYNPGIGRFISEDPIRGFIGDYTYVGSDPMEFTDPTGLVKVNWKVEFKETPLRDLLPICHKLTKWSKFGCMEPGLGISFDCTPCDHTLSIKINALALIYFLERKDKLWDQPWWDRLISSDPTLEALQAHELAHAYAFKQFVYGTLKPRGEALEHPYPSDQECEDSGIAYRTWALQQFSDWDESD
jgi:RHS repeat-associated protein